MYRNSKLIYAISVIFIGINLSNCQSISENKAKTTIPTKTETKIPTKNNETNTTTFPLGTNLNGIADWSTQYPFTDYFKNSRQWVTHGEKVWSTDETDKLEIDENGWVKSLNGGKFTSIGTFIPNDKQGRRFVVLYDGEGTIEYKFSAKKDEAVSQPGRDIFDAEPDSHLHLRITETDPNNTENYIRNIRVIPEEYEQIYQSQIFNPDFLKSLEGYQVLRFMDWMKTNNSQQQEWNNRPKVNDTNYSKKGVPVEVMVKLANQTGINPWFTLPHRATDDYVRNFAKYVKENLNPNLKIYVEFSNEVWNFQFKQARYAQEQGKQEFANLEIKKIPFLNYWYGKRSMEIAQIWDEVFGAEKERVIGVLATQAANSWTAKKSLEYIKSIAGVSYEEAGIDAIAIAPYFGFPLGKEKNVKAIENWTKQGMDYALDQLFAEVTKGGVLPEGYPGGSIQRSRDLISKYVELAESAGLDLIAYEGGQHIAALHQGMENNEAIVDLFAAANRDPRMGEAYREYFAMWQEVAGGGLFAHFLDVGRFSKWGSWGSRESLYQESSPKFNALQELVAE
ncbi:MAG: cellulose-binding protein [Microcoleaceae cyanobacterium MO_207.B10]|nr:cellulose-binding protein [Microcoleaceae cyanobacterium MO_207.B10]